jgi:hypothetical protein
MDITNTTMLPLSALRPNTGQVPGLPKNPRFIKDGRFAALRDSIQADPEMLYLRELLVLPYEGQYIIIAGNMRYRAMRDLGHTEAPCKILPADTPTERLRAWATKDNVPFGDWDTDILANDWDMEELAGWGLEVPGWDEATRVEDDEKDLSDSLTMDFKIEVTLTCEEEQEDLFNKLVNEGYECRVLTL